MEMNLIHVTPEIAREYLENNHNNRPIRHNNVKALARDMRNDDWRLVGDPICFDRLGNLIDGQHRLAAVVESGKTIPFYVATGLAPEDSRVIDAGMSRRAGDQLVMDGNRANGVALASALRLLFTLEEGRPYDNSMKVTNQELFHTAERHPGLLDSVLAVKGLSRLVFITPMNGAVAHYIGSARIPTTTYQFFEKLRTAANCTATDPALLLRNRMTSGYERPGRLAQLWLVLHALILTKDDVFTITNLQLPRGSKITPDRVTAQMNKLLSYRDERPGVDA